MAERDHYRRILSSRNFVLVYVAGWSCLLLQGCAGLRPRNPLPEDQESKVQIPGMPGVRSWGDEVSETFTKFALESIEQERAVYGKISRKGRHFSWPYPVAAMTAPLAPGFSAAGPPTATAPNSSW